MNERNDLADLIESLVIEPDSDQPEHRAIRAARVRLRAGSPTGEVLTASAAAALQSLAPERYDELAGRHGWPDCSSELNGLDAKTPPPPG